jgi:hypothetical protein
MAMQDGVSGWLRLSFLLLMILELVWNGFRVVCAQNRKGAGMRPAP